jgi:DNA-binding NarL/FixJ family response regulator
VLTAIDEFLGVSHAAPAPEPSSGGLVTIDSPAQGGALRQPDGLTPREVEVLRLIATGRTNSEIAADLTLSVRTVARHITNIYTKIGARNKADATAYTHRHGLR